MASKKPVAKYGGPYRELALTDNLVAGVALERGPATAGDYNLLVGTNVKQITIGRAVTGDPTIRTFFQGDVWIDKDLWVQGSEVVVGGTTFQGDVTFGDQVTDKVTFVSRLASGVDPDTTHTYDLGTSALCFNDIYAEVFRALAAAPSTRGANYHWSGIDAGVDAGGQSYNIVVGKAPVDTAGGGLTCYAGQAGDAVAAPGTQGGTALWRGGRGAAGTVVLAAGKGGPAQIVGGQGGNNAGGGGNDGGDAELTGGTPTGAGVGGVTKVGGNPTSAIDIGNATTNPNVKFLGTGGGTVGGGQWNFSSATQFDVPDTAGATITCGGAGVTLLTAVALNDVLANATPGNGNTYHTHAGVGPGGVQITVPAGEAMSAGQIAVVYDTGAGPGARKANADGAAAPLRQGPVAVVVSCAFPGNAIMMLVGETEVADADWVWSGAGYPVAADVGKPAYLSKTDGKWGEDTSLYVSGDEEVRMGIVTRGSNGAGTKAKVAVLRGESTILA